MTPFSPMLAQPYDKHKHKLTYPIISQPKLDGIRCIVTKDGCFSRYGNKFFTTKHIEQAILPVFQEWPDLVLDGELYVPNDPNFPQLCSMIKKQRPTQEELATSSKVQFWMFDCFHPFMPKYCGDYRARYDNLASLPLKWALDLPIKLLGYDPASSEADLDGLYEGYRDAGYEGQMVKVPGHQYIQRRTNFLLKRKGLEKDRFVITNIIEGQGKWSGMVGMFECVTHEGRKFTAALADTDVQRALFWDRRAELIGKQAVVEYQVMTPAGSPRHPRVKGVIE